MNLQSLEKMCSWERQKAIYLLGIAEKLGMNTSSYGEIAVNANSGYTYLWLEDYNFTLYMPINCELEKSDVWVMYTDMNNGEETEITLNNKTLNDLEKWVEGLENEEAEEENE